MVKFGKTEIAKEKFYAAIKSINIWDINVDNVVISKLVEIIPGISLDIKIKI